MGRRKNKTAPPAGQIIPVDQLNTGVELSDDDVLINDDEKNSKLSRLVNNTTNVAVANANTATNAANAAANTAFNTNVAATTSNPVKQTLTVNLEHMQLKDLYALNFALNTLLEIHEAVVEYDDMINDSDRRDNRKLNTKKSKYLDFVSVIKMTSTDLVAKYCNINFASDDDTYIASCLRLVQTRVEYEIELGK